MSYQSSDSLYDDINDDVSQQHSLLNKYHKNNHNNHNNHREAEQFVPFETSSSSSSQSSFSLSSIFRSRRSMMVMIAIGLLMIFGILLRSSLHSSNNNNSSSSSQLPSSEAADTAFTSLSIESLSQRDETHHHGHHHGDENNRDDNTEYHHGRRSSHSPDSNSRHSRDNENSGSDSDNDEKKSSSPHHSQSHNPSHNDNNKDNNNKDDNSDNNDSSYSASAAPDVGSISPSPLTGNNPDDKNSPLTSVNCEPPYPGYPFCESKVNELQQSWTKDPDRESELRAAGVDGSKCSFLTYLNKNGFYCPEAGDYNKMKIRGVNIGGWLVLEPWIKPSLFTQFSVEDNVKDQWTFCEKLGKTECKKQLESHWNSWLTYQDLKELFDGGINHIRIPVGYWLFGDISSSEPWVTGDLYYLERALKWCSEIGMHVILDLHCAPGSQNGFDNSGKMGEVHFADTEIASNGRITYPNINRALKFIDQLTEHFSGEEYKGIVVGIELVNEAFISIPLEIVKDYYLQGYDKVKKYGDIAVVIGDSFRFGSWGDFMFPPHYRHVWIDTHIYQVFDAYRLSFTHQQHIQQTCKINKPEVAVAPLSTMVGEWSLATVDCARWLNGYNNGARYDGTYHLGNQSPEALGSCQGQNDINDSTVWTPEYKEFLKQFAEAQMDAYESGSAAGWFFWNFKTESAPQWDYILGLREGWMPKDHSKRQYTCESLMAQ